MRVERGLLALRNRIALSTDAHQDVDLVLELEIKLIYIKGEI